MVSMGLYGARSQRQSVFGTPGQTDHGHDWDCDLVGARQMKITSISNGEQKDDAGIRATIQGQSGCGNGNQTGR